MPFTTSLEKRQDERDRVQAIGRGLACRCPACGQGRLFGAFLKPAPVCASCGEDLSHQRADDLPPYLVITILGHVLVGGMVLAERFADWSMTTHMLIWPPLVIILGVGMIQPVKGGVIGLQWALRMHGFGGEHEEFEAADKESNR